MTSPTTEDAGLYLQLLEISQGATQVEARRWVVHDMRATTLKQLDDQHPAGSLERDKLVNLLGFFEAAAALISHGLLHEDIFFEAPFAFHAVWAAVGELIDDWQKQADDPSILENVQWLGRRYDIWLKTVRKPKLEAVPPDRKPGREWGEQAEHVGFTKS